MTEPTRRLLANLRRALLRLHKVLLDDERAAYERAYGRTSGGEMLQLVIHDEQFAWLHPVSELVVRIDEMLESEESSTSADARELITQTRALLAPAEAGGAFGRKYYAALQREPDAVLAHAEVSKLLEQISVRRRKVGKLIHESATCIVTMVIGYINTI